MDNRGKSVCEELKAVRRRIAAENGIELEIPECTYEGPCKGTCPRCESEVRFLENELARRIRMGKVATVAGLALTLGVTGSAAAQSTEPATVPPSHERQTGDCEVTGVVVDARSREPLPFVSVMLYKDTAKAMVVTTDFDGRYRFNVQRGNYTLVVRSVGYNEYRREVKVRKSEEQCAMELTYNPAQYDTYDTPKVDTIGMTAPMMGLVEVVFETKCTVVDLRTKEPLPFVNVIFKKDGKVVAVKATDFDGGYTATLPEGKYDLEVSYVGYKRYMRTGLEVPAKEDVLVELQVDENAIMEEMMGIITDPVVPLLDPTVGGVQVGAEVEGVPLRIQY